MLVLLSLATSAFAQGVPDRSIPPSVMMEVRLLENRFDLALAIDCSSERCFSKGCAYVEHAVADQPRSGSLPGLGLDPGPNSVPPQEYLTRARCQFAYEESVEAKDAQALARRLQSKLSQAWTAVSVGTQKLPPLPQYLLDEPVPEADTDVPVEPEPEPEPLPPEEWSFGAAVHELWDALLPHFFWMIGLGLVTLFGILLIWAWRRVGRDSLEDQALLAAMTNGFDDEPEDAPDDLPADADDTVEEPAFVAHQGVLWDERLARLEPDAPNPELTSLIRELLRNDELPLLATAVNRFPEHFPPAFPSGGDIANAKLRLAEYLKAHDSDDLTADADFFRQLNRRALSAALVSQSDAEVVRSLRDEFGASGLVELIRRLPSRAGALLFSLAPSTEQAEMVRLLPRNVAVGVAEQLLQSNRMDDSETTYLFDVLSAVRSGNPLPAAPPVAAVSDRGPTHDATGSLSALLPGLGEAKASELFGAALQRFNGHLPSWHRGIFYPEMLFALSNEARSDLLLELDVDRVAAWFSMLDGTMQTRLLNGMPNALRASVQGVVFPSRERQTELAEEGRQLLAKGFQTQLARAGLTFEDVVGGVA